MSYKFNPFSGQLDNIGPPQGYFEFVYNSSGSQSDNRFNDWNDLYAKIIAFDGNKRIIFEQNETLPAGTYNLDGVEFFCYVPNALGGPEVTLDDGFEASSWVGGIINGIKLISISTAPIITVNGLLLFTVLRAASLITTTNEIFDVQAGSFFVLVATSSAIGTSSYTYEIVNVANTATTIVSMSGQDATLYNDSVRGAGNLNIYIYSNAVDPSNKSTTHTNHSGGQNNILNTFSSTTGYNNSISGLIATDAQGAIDELVVNTTGDNGTFTTVDSKTVTVTNGIITSIV